MASPRTVFKGEHELFRRSVSAFIDREVAPHYERWEKEGQVSREVWRKAGEAGLLLTDVPEEYGGAGADFLYSAVMIEEMAKRVFAAPGFRLHSDIVAPYILNYGSEEQKRAWLPRLVSGKAIGAHAITEPGAGSDVFSLSSRAVRKPGGYVLTGQKTFSTNAPVADLVLAFAYLQRDGQSPALTAFLVPRETDGVTFGKAISKMGLRTSPMGEVIFEDCFVPEAARLGPEGAGMRIFNSAMEWERACIFAGHLGAMERLLDDCIVYAKKRKQFGQPIAKFAAVADRIADMRVAIEAGRWLLYKVGWLTGQGKSAVLESAMAKLFVSEMHSKAALDALQLHGGYGYMKEYPIEREVRDALSGTLYSGTSEMQRKIIASCLGL